MTDQVIGDFAAADDLVARSRAAPVAPRTPLI